MIELGKVQKLQIVRRSPRGLYLNSIADKCSEDILLPNNQVPPDAKIGDEIEVFVYKDSKDRIISTMKRPRLTLGEISALKVVENTNIGAFLNWGLEKDLFMPFKEQLGRVAKGDTCLVALYIDKSGRLCATMNIYNHLSSESPYKVNDRVKGTIYNINKELGAFVAVDNKYQGLIPNKELFGSYKEGDWIEVRVKKVRQDGKLELSVRNEAYNEIESDARRILERLKLNGGMLKLNDNSSPERIKAEFNISKAAFKRAVGRLLKEGTIEITDEGIRLRW